MTTEMVVSALVQEGVSRSVSFVLGSGKHGESSTSREHSIERLEMAHTELELAMERSSKFPLTDRSLLRRRKILKRALEECGDVLHRTKLLLVQEEEDAMAKRRVTEAATHSSFPTRLAHVAKSSIANLFASKKDDLMSCSDDVQRFGWLADCASKFVRDVESGCSLGHYTFCNPLVRYLLEGKTLMYENEMQQGSQLRRLYIWPVHLEGRGVEAQLRYWFVDRKVPAAGIAIELLLRLSESTDMVGIAIRSLRSVASLFNLVAESAEGELTFLASKLSDMSHSCSPPWLGIQESHTKRTYCLRPDPVCCKENGDRTCAGIIDSSELSDRFPEQVIFFSLKCSTSALKYSLPNSSPEAGSSTSTMADSVPCLEQEVTIGFVPHFVDDKQQESYAVEVAGDNEQRRNVSAEQVAEAFRSDVVSRFLCKPELTYYGMQWTSKHGCAGFYMHKSMQAQKTQRHRTNIT